MGVRQVLAGLTSAARILVGTVLIAGMATAAMPSANAQTTLRVALQTFDTDFLDPTQVAFPTSYGLLGGMWNWQTIFTADGKVEPGLAVKWTQAADNLSWTVEYRKGVTFHDGSEVTAEDVRFTLMEAFRRADAKSSSKAALAALIKDVKVVDKHTARIELNRPWLTFPGDISNIGGIEGIVLPKAYIERVGWDGFAKHPIGTGPWKFVSRVVGNYVEYEAFKNHYAGAPQFEKLRLLLVPEDATRVAMLRTDQVDIAPVAADSVDELEKAGVKVIADPWPSTVRITLFASYYENAGPTAKTEVRKALNLAINRDEITKSLFRGRATPAALEPISPKGFGFPAHLKPYPYNPEEARKLLATAGYRNGFPMKLYAFAVGGFTMSQQLAEVVAAYWEAIGVKTEVVLTDWASMSRMILKDEMDRAIVGQAGTLVSGSRYNSLADVGVWWSLSGKRIKGAGNVDGMLAQGNESKTVEEMAKHVDTIYSTLYNDYRSIPIAYIDGALWAHGKRVGSIDAKPSWGYFTPNVWTSTLAKR